MRKIKDMIVEVLKEELEHHDADTNYSQWVLGVSIKKERTNDSIVGNPMYLARVVVKTSDSPYVDGMDITFMVPEDDVIIEAKYFENTPEFQGGTEEDSLRWIGLDEIYYLQLDNPFPKAVDMNEKQ